MTIVKSVDYSQMNHVRHSTMVEVLKYNDVTVRRNTVPNKSYTELTCSYSKIL